MLIELRKLSFSYRGEAEESLDNISLDIPPGQCLLLCGSSGCGKTSLTRLINGLIPHFFPGNLRGSVCILGKDASERSLAELSDIVGSVFQNPRTQFFNADTDSEIVFGMENQGLPAAAIESRLAEITEELGLQDLRGRSIFELSGGEKQKIAFASSYAVFPKILVLDEPSSNLDNQSILELAALLKRAKQDGMTVLTAEHRIWYLTDIVDRVLFMRKGRIERDLSAKEFGEISEREYRKMGLRSRRMIPERRESGTELSAGGKRFSAEDLSVMAGSVSILKNVDFEAKGGEIIAIVGKNGAGKTTLARVLCGLQSAKGRLLLEGRAVSRKERMKISYMVMQDVGHQLFTESVEEECALGTKRVSRDRIDDALCRMELCEYRKKHPLSLSGGQKQRLVIAVSLLCDKELLVFDEPTSGLDLYGMQKVAALLEELSEQNKLIFVITHDLELIERVCSRLLCLEDGKIVQDRERKDFGKFYGGLKDER